MFKIPLEVILQKIKEKTGLDDNSINSKINDKMSQLSGLISKEGAAHIVANELGVKLLESLSGKLQIKNILEGMRSVDTLGRVQQIFEIREFQSENRQGKVASAIIADETGSIRVVMWGTQADIIKKLNENSTVKIVNGYVRNNNSRLEIHLNDKSKLIIDPPGETVGEIKKAEFNRKKINELNESDDNTELFGTIVQVFEPRFFEICPQCSKRARMHEESFVCDTHGKVVPNYSYVLNLFLDDGSENIRTVFFRNHAEKLLNINNEQFLAYKDKPEEFEKLKTELLGKQIKVIGRVKKNDMFDRLEFVAQLVYPNPDPGEELNRLEKV